jgi:uncharacterized delta-60 repeat protein
VKLSLKRPITSFINQNFFYEKYCTAFLTTLFSLFAIHALSQMPDVSFSTDGELGPFTNGFHANKMGQQSTGKIILGGYLRDDDGFFSMAAMRLNTDGSVDNTFGSLGMKVISFLHGSDAYALTIQPDDKIIIAGVQWVALPIFGDRDTTYIEVIRLNADGSKDLTFGTDGVATFHFGGEFRDVNSAASLALQSDGKIIVGGEGGAFTQFLNPAPLLMRLNVNGSLDNTFNGNGRLFLSNLLGRFVSSVAVQTDGKIVALVGINSVTSETRVMRFNSDGSTDASFGSGGTQTFNILSYNQGHALTLQSDGKILIAGNTYALASGSESSLNFWVITRLNTNGSLDNSFGSSGQKAIDFGDDFNYNNGIPAEASASSISVLPSGKIVVAGSSFDNVIHKHDVAVARLNANGSLDNNFGDGGKYFFGLATNYVDDYFLCAKLQTDGKFLVASHRYLGLVSNGANLFVNRLLLVRSPKITCPDNITVNHDAGKCTALVSFSATATGDPLPTISYKIGNTTITSPYNFPVGVTTVNATATNGISPDATCSFTVSVVDNTPPVISNASPSVSILSPANHTMRNVTINYDVIDECPLTAVLTVSSNEPVNGVGDGDTDPDWVVIDDHHVQLRAERSAAGSGRIYTITITATDGSGNSDVKMVEVRVPHDIKNPHSGQAFIVGSTVNFSGEFWDKPGNSHSAKWLIDDNLSVKGIVTEPVGNKNGKVTGIYKFTAPGVYKLQMNITDQTGLTTYTNTAGDLEAIVVIFDPNGGNIYGGGYFNSPAGALRSNPTATGKASYGFAMNYFKNSTYPKGETQFEFKVGSFEFNALNFEYLVISNSMAQFKGTGKIIGGQSGVGFIMTVTDGQLDGSGIDKIRMKIYNKNNGNIIYDNQPGASDAALPTQAVGTNSIIVISGANGSLTSANTNQKGEMEARAPEVLNKLDVITYPNPSTNSFSITVQSKVKEKITMQVMDMYGRIIETRNVTVNSIVKFGDHYRPGTYFVRIIEGKEHKEIKLIKMPD